MTETADEMIAQIRAELAEASRKDMDRRVNGRVVRESLDA